MVAGEHTMNAFITEVIWPAIGRQGDLRAIDARAFRLFSPARVTGARGRKCACAERGESASESHAWHFKTSGSWIACAHLSVIHTLKHPKRRSCEEWTVEPYDSHFIVGCRTASASARVRRPAIF